MNRCAWLLKQKGDHSTHLQSAIGELISDDKLPTRLQALFDEELWNRIQVIEIGQNTLETLRRSTGWDSAIFYSPSAHDFVLFGDISKPGEEVIATWEQWKREIELDSDFEIHVPVLSDNETPSLIKLLHELAHVRFEIAFRANIEKLCERYPSLIRKLKNGLYFVDKPFRTFLTERYAYETELLGNAWVDRDLARKRFNGMDPDLAKSWRRISVSIFMHPGYGLTRPHLRQFVDTPLEEILGYSLD